MYTDQCTNGEPRASFASGSTPIGVQQEEVMTGKRTTRHDPASHLRAASARWGGTTYKNAPTKSVSVGGTRFVYRELGIDSGVPVIFVNHLAANLDNWDPRVVDGIAAKHRVITFDNRGVGGSEGKTPDTIEAMAQDAVAFIRALGFDQVDLLGFSLGGMVSQVIAQIAPTLVRRIILAGTGPAGGEGIDDVTKLTYLHTFHAYATFKDPADLSRIQQPVLVANGDADRMVPSTNSYDRAHRLPNATLRVYPDAGHGGIF